MSDVLGARGEAIFTVLMTEFHSTEGPIFKPQFLGDKWPTVDFIVELLGAGDEVPYFFVQVRTTRRGFTSRARRLRVGVAEHEIRRLAAYPAPTYVVGIDEVGGSGYVVSANGERLAAMPTLPAVHAVDRATRERLWHEVRAYWAARRPPSFVSEFADPAWSTR